MRSSHCPNRRFYALCCAAVTLFTDGSVAADAPGIDAYEHASIGDAPSSGETVAASAPPAVPRDLSLLWLAPVGAGQTAADRATAPLASGVALYREGKYANAVAQLSARASLSTPAGHYAAYYAAKAQLALGNLEDARQRFASITARQPVGFLSEAAALGEAEAAQAAGDAGAGRRIYERLLTRSPMAPDELWMKVGRARLATGERSAAIEAFRHVHERYPLSVLNSIAASELSKLQALEPLARGNARYRVELERADHLFAAKRYPEARVAFERLRVHATGAEHVRLQIRRAACEYYTRQYAAARATLGPHRESGPHHIEARFFDLMSARALGADAEFVRLARDFVGPSGGTTWAEEVLDALATHFIKRNQDHDADAAFRQLLATFPAGRFAERAAWKVGWRAYRSGNAAEALSVFSRAAAMFPRSDYRPAFLYWAGRARQTLGDTAVAASWYALVQTDYTYSYYGRLAEAALHQWRDRAVRTALHDFLAALRTPQGSEQTASLPPTAGTITLLLSAGLYSDALAEIRYAQQRWGDTPVLRATIGWVHHQQGELLSGANLVKRAYPQYIAADGAALPSELLAVIFPVGYWSLIRQHAVRHQLDPYLLAAVIAQESGFIPDIHSRAKAAGLMQLMPATAQRYARRLGLSYSPAILTRPETNIGMGMAYFADLVREFGEVHLALASYNAGENRIRRWIAERPDLSPDEFIDDIPFPETQTYVKKILGAAENYRRVYGAAAGLPADPNRAIPSLASRRTATGQAPQRRSAKPSSAASKTKPSTAGSKATSSTPKSVESLPARKATRSGTTQAPRQP